MKATIEIQEAASSVHGGKGMTIYKVVVNALKGVGKTSEEIKEGLLDALAENTLNEKPKKNE